MKFIFFSFCGNKIYCTVPKDERKYKICSDVNKISVKKKECNRDCTVASPLEEKYSKNVQQKKSDIILIDDVRYLTITEIASSLQLKIISNCTKNTQVAATKGDVAVKFTVGSLSVLYQGVDIFLQHPIKIQGMDLLVSYDDYFNILVPLLSVNLIEKPSTVKTIVIDAGHGGKDPGAINSSLNILEKNLTLEIAKLLKIELTKKGYNVVMTRDDDTFIVLSDRSLFSKNCDFFISIHINSATNSQAKGIEVYTLNRNKNFDGNIFDQWNLIAGYCILSELEKSISAVNRGLKMAEFVVLQSLKTPGILAELGFLSNNDEAKKLSDPLYQNKIVQGLVNGVEKYTEITKR